jgi:P4 family phage/plasmid primase-like protien
MAITEKIIDLYLSLGRDLIPERNRMPIKGYRKGTHYTKKQLLQYVKRGYNLGWVLGPRDLVLDVDPRNGGRESYYKICDKLGIKDLSIAYPTVKTGGGGYHYYMRLPNKFDARQFKVDLEKLKGVELKHAGLKVTIAGSTHHKTGKPYKIDVQSPFRSKPKPIKKALLKQYFKMNGDAPNLKKTSKNKTVPVISTKKLYMLLKCLPIEDYAVHEDWLNIMMAAHSATAGKGLKAFLKWSNQDTNYINDTALTTTRWNSLKSNEGITIRTLLKEVRKYDKSIKLKDLTEFKVLLSNDLSQQLVNQLLHNKFKDGEHLLHGADQRYWRYNDTHWEILAPNLVSQYLLKEIETFKHKNPDTKRSTASILSDCERLLRANVASSKNMTFVEHSRSIINTHNFELWINDDTGEIDMRDHDPKSNLTYCLDTDYDLMADCKRFDRALKEIFIKDSDRKEIIRHFWEIIGYMIQNKKNIPIWVMLQGGGSNGKKVLIQVTSALMGTALCAKSIDEIDTRRNNHALADLPGKLAIIDDDVDSNAKLPDGMLKKLSENKAMTANPKGSPPFSFMNTAVVMMAANNWPRTKDLSLGMRRRALVFQLKRTFSEQEAELNLVDYVIENELAGVLNRALAGLKRLRSRGYFKVPESCKQAANVWFSSSSQVHQFLEDRLAATSRGREKFSDVWEAYRSWAYDQGIKSNYQYQRSYFKRLLLDLNLTIKHSTSNRLYLYGYKLLEGEK